MKKLDIEKYKRWIENAPDERAQKIAKEMLERDEVRLALAETDGLQINLDVVASITRNWQDRNFPDIAKIEATLGLCEEVGEVARAVLKEKLGIRPETRGDVGDELGDVLLLAIALADRHGLSARDCLMRRVERMLKLDFTKDPEGGR